MNAKTGERLTWEQQHVVDVRDASFAARTYYEHRELRRFLSSHLPQGLLGAGCEVGAGFGRITPILSEYCERAVGFERELHFVTEASALYPFLTFTHIDTLARLPAKEGAFDLALTFTVLQHLVDVVCRDVSKEISRVVKPGGFLVLCEETDAAHRAGDTVNPASMCTIGRTVADYVQCFDTFELLATMPRLIEPTYGRRDVGTHMLFRRV